MAKRKSRKRKTSKRHVKGWSPAKKAAYKKEKRALIHRYNKKG